MTTRFTHDCSSCVHLGGDEQHDFYFCASPTNPILDTVIARFGNQPWEYASGLEIGKHRLEAGDTQHPLAKALALTKERGLYREPKKPRFSYVARGLENQRITGEVEASTEADAKLKILWDTDEAIAIESIEELT